MKHGDAAFATLAIEEVTAEHRKLLTKIREYAIVT